MVGAFESRLLFSLWMSPIFVLNDQWAIGFWWSEQVSIPSHDLSAATSNRTVTSGHPNLVVGAFESRLWYIVWFMDFSHISLQ
jgi:hypothetical protein